MVPSLVAVEKCMDIPKEVCIKVEEPRMVQKTVTRLFCETASLPTTHIPGEYTVNPDKALENTPVHNFLVIKIYIQNFIHAEYLIFKLFLNCRNLP